LDAFSTFYLHNTGLMMEAVRSAQDRHEAIRTDLEAELAAVRATMTQKEQAVDQYMTDYEEGAIAQEIIERRVAKLSDDLTGLRHRRDQLQFELDNTPATITEAELASLNTTITKIITLGDVAKRKALCELTLDKIEINTATSTATPTYRIDIAHALDAINAADNENAPTGNPAGANLSSSQAVRERRPRVELRGFEPLTPSMRTLGSAVEPGLCPAQSAGDCRVETISGGVVAVLRCCTAGSRAGPPARSEQDELDDGRRDADGSTTDAGPPAGAPDAGQPKESAEGVAEENQDELAAAVHGVGPSGCGDGWGVLSAPPRAGGTAPGEARRQPRTCAPGR
jgi:hypothetical protein